MSIATQASGHGDVALLRRGLARGGHDVVLREACRAAVFPTGDRVHKLRKPVRFDVADRSVQTP